MCKYNGGEADKDLQIHYRVSKSSLMPRPLILLLILIIATISLAAQQRPLLTDDIDITPAGSMEISAGVDFYQNAKFPLSGIKGDMTRIGDIRIRTGFASNVELQIEGTLQNYVAINSFGPSAVPLNISGNISRSHGGSDASLRRFLTLRRGRFWSGRKRSPP